MAAEINRLAHELSPLMISGTSGRTEARNSRGPASASSTATITMLRLQPVCPPWIAASRRRFEAKSFHGYPLLAH
jgi:hypothetical protein